jgi:putative copper export protein
MSGDALSWLMLIVKFALYGFGLTAAGLALHTVLGVVEPDRRAHALKRSALAASVAACLSGLRVLLTNAQLSGNLGGAFDPASFGWTWAAQGSGTAAVFVSALALWSAALLSSRTAAAIGAIALAASFGLVGHAQALAAPGIAPWIAAAHVLLAALWFAAPISLWPSTAIEPTALLARVRRFSAIAIAAVPALFILGLWLLWRLAWPDVLSSGYGLLLTAKLGVAILGLGLGSLNKTIVTKALETDTARGARLLSWTLRLEAAIFFIALALVAWATTLTGPPEA